MPTDIQREEQLVGEVQLEGEEPSPGDVQLQGEARLPEEAQLQIEAVLQRDALLQEDAEMERKMDFQILEPLLRVRSCFNPEYLLCKTDTDAFFKIPSTVNEGNGPSTVNPTISFRGRVRWVPCRRGQVPALAIPVGRDKDGEPLFVGRAYHGGDLLPAKVLPNHPGAYVTRDGVEYCKEEYEVLLSPDIAWMFTCKGAMPRWPFIVGYTSSGELLYIGRAFYDGAIIPGKVQNSQRCLQIAHDSKEVAIQSYEFMFLL